MKPFIYEFSGLRAEAVFSALADQPYSLFLDSADRGHKGGQCSYIAAFPDEIIEGRDFEQLQGRLDFHGLNKERVEGLPSFQSGAAGLFTYEGDIRAGIYSQVMAFDHAQDKAWLIIHEGTQEEADEKRDRFLTKKNSSAAQADIEWGAQTKPALYKQHVKQVIDYVCAGDIFQANLSQKFEADLPGNFDAYAHYLHLREVNPAPYAAFMNFGDMKISSASPESFLKVENGIVETRPIKGTQPRDANPVQDAQNKTELLNSAKDRAENIMIVDLLRNDLSKVCAAASVEVADLCRLESFSGVHHLVSTVRGRLREDKTVLDALAACFPGGSVTGAPKIRAMEILSEIEGEKRGPYCGSVGYFGFDGAMQSNILIRTLVYEGAKVSFRTGGGITAQSDADAEYQETMDKAARIFTSFENTKQRRSA
ncbi:MAG: aminodeoxychorismate synthase component I [Alphaproteobacteria bacterium]